MSDRRSSRRMSGGAMRLAGSGGELAAAVGGGCLLGYWVDRHFGTEPWGLLTCAVIAIVGGLYNLVRRELEAVGRDAKRWSKKKASRSDDGADA